MPEPTPADVMRTAAGRLRHDAAAVRAQYAENGCITDGHGPDECYAGSVDDGLGGLSGIFASCFTPGWADLLATSWDTLATEMADYPAVHIKGGIGIALYPDQPSEVWTSAHAAAQAYLTARGADG